MLPELRLFGVQGVGIGSGVAGDSVGTGVRIRGCAAVGAVSPLESGNAFAEQIQFGRLAFLCKLESGAGRGHEGD